MFKLLVTAFTIAMSTAPSIATASDPPQVIEKPSFNSGDTWTYRLTNRAPNGETNERHVILSVVTANSRTFLQSEKNADSSMPPVERLRGNDLSQTVSIKGEETLVSKPFDFPLRQGKKWDISFETENPKKNVKKQKIKVQYQGVGWEEVSVPAGKFQAFKVEAEGTWYSEFNATASTSGAVSQQDTDGTTVVIKNQKGSVPAPMAGKIIRTYWYAPAIKREVKNVEEDYAPNGTLAKRNTLELESYTLDGAAKK